jgi:hypothetical protein
MPNWILIDVTGGTGFVPFQSEAPIKPCAFASAGGTQVLAFRGNEKHIYVLWAQAAASSSITWQIVDLWNSAPIASQLAAQTDPAGFWAADGSVHVVFIGSDNHIYDVSCPQLGDSWTCVDVISATSPNQAPLALPQGLPYARPAAFVWATQGSNHIVYVSQNVSSPGNNDIYELVFQNNRWSCSNVSAAVQGGLPPNPYANPVGYVWESQGTKHIVYMSTAGGQHVHELYSSGDGWSHNDLTDLTQAPQCTSLPQAYMWEQTGTEHVVFMAASGIYELYYDGTWHANNLTPSEGATSSLGPPMGYTYNQQNTEHVVYATQTVYELYAVQEEVLGIVSAPWRFSRPGGATPPATFKASWASNDLTEAAGASVGAASFVTGFAWQDPFTGDTANFEAVVYVGTDSHVYELAYAS